jgi:uncharacterized protein YodC (DUF2158 family)
MTKFDLGDIVRLKSGGPEMRIIWIDEDEITCRLLGTGDRFIQGNYNANSLRKVAEDEFRLGDIVRPKSGGSEMSVLSVHGDIIICA